MQYSNSVVQQVIDDIDKLAIITLNEHGNIDGWNSGAERLTGYTIKDIASDQIDFLFPEGTFTTATKGGILEEVIKKKKLVYEGWCLRKDGTKSWNNVVLSTNEDAVSGYRCYYLVIKDRSANEENQDLRAFGKKNLQAIIDNNTDDLIWSVDLNFRLVTCNRYFEDMIFTLSGQRIKPGDSVLETKFDAHKISRYKSLYEQAIAGSVARTIEYFDIPEPTYIETSAYPIKSNDATIGVACFAKNITERKLNEAKIIISEHKFRTLIEQSSDGIAIISAQNELLYVSPSIKNILGYSEEEIKEINILSLAHPDDIGPMIKVMELALASPGIPIKGHTGQMRHKDGSWRWLEATVTNMLHDPSINGLVDNFRDVTEKRHAREKILHANRLYAFISQINQTIVHAKTEQIVFEESCRIAHEIGKFQAAWIGLYDSNCATVNLVAQSGLPIDSLPMFIDAAVVQEDLQGYVLRHNSYYVSNNVQADLYLQVWREFAARNNYNSCIVMPIRKSGVIIGSFNLYASEQDFFNNEEIALATEATGDISFAMDVFEKERHRTESEQRLKHEKRRLKQAQSIAHIGSWEYDCVLKTYNWSEEHCNIYGVDPRKNTCTLEEWLSFIHVEDRDEVSRKINEAMQLKQNVSFRHRIVKSDGQVRYISRHSQFEYDEQNNLITVYGVSHDITELMEAEQKLINVNRLYSFTSHINHTIVHVDNEQLLFNEACHIAISIGQFKMAWIGKVDTANMKINLAEHYGLMPSDVDMLTEFRYKDDGPQNLVIKSGKAYICNDIQNDIVAAEWKEFARNYNIGSYMLLPIRKSGVVYATLNVCAQDLAFFNTEEVRLLEEAVGDISFALDVFEKEHQKKEMEAKMQHTELKLREAQEIAHFGNWENSFETGVAIWSEEALRIYGLPPEDYAQSYDVWISFIHPEDLPHVLAEIEKSRETFSDSAFYHRIIRRDGTIRYIYSQSKFEFDNTGRPIGMSGVEHDVTDMKKAEETLRQSKENLRLIVDLIPQTIFAIDAHGKFVFANKSFAALYNSTPKELVHRRVEDMIADKERAALFIERAREVIESKQSKIIPEMQFTDHAGNNKIFYAMKVPFTPTGSNEVAMLGVWIDITDHKRQEAEKAKMIADIVQRNQDLEQFSYIISHNLRGPVANIIGLADMLQEKEYYQDEDKELIEGLSISVKKLDSVINDLNYILQVKHQVSENREVVRFSELLADIQLSIANMLSAQDVQIISDFSAADEMLTLKSYLYSVFFNLISNSIKYRQPDVKPIIRINSSCDERSVKLTFSDNGLGINMKQKKDQVFGLYKRFHGHTEGKGMGLYMVKTQVEALGGHITIESEVNVGTTFCITFEYSPLSTPTTPVAE